MSCDMCGKKGEELSPIRDEYKTKDVKHVCSNCCTVMDNQLSKLRKVNRNILESCMRSFADNFRNVQLGFEKVGNKVLEPEKPRRMFEKWVITGIIVFVLFLIYIDLCDY